MRTTIIGAGPIGTYLAWQLSRRGHDVTLIEEHETIGEPVRCAGILTDTITNYLNKKDLASTTQTTITETVVHGPHTETTIPLTTNHVIDNAAYAQLLAGKAHDHGTTIKTHTRYEHNTAKDATWKDLRTKKTTTKTTDLLIGADGPTSAVARNNDLYGKRTFLAGIQAIIKTKEEDDRIHFYPHIGAYAWYCPAGDGHAKIGVAAERDAKSILDSFSKWHPGRQLQLQGGPIPLHQPRTKNERRYQDMKVQLIGDAALHIKNTTGGGIVPGTRAAAIHADDPDNYAKNLAPLNRELRAHWRLNNALRRCTTNDWDRLITQANHPRVQRALQRTDRDHATALAARLLLAKPALALWARKLIK
ncbi:NAD(P)/FAD-dependent oxidoreductase [Candidatus Woesearchaeota archaeon]|nr:NAD(P)/FAD-dependent oxidoreductase [Candidatus Woesearchaeota archaeon]